MNTNNSSDPFRFSDKEAWARLNNRPGERVTWRFVVCLVILSAALATGVYWFYQHGGLQI